jgi:hypothetical protein
MRLTNNKLANKEITEIVRELKKFIAGGATSNNLLNFVQDIDSADSLLNDFTNAVQSDSSEANLEEINHRCNFYERYINWKNVCKR